MTLSPMMTPVRLSAPSGWLLVTESECVIWWTFVAVKGDGPFGESPVTTTDGVLTRFGLKIAAISLSRLAFSSF